MIHRNAREHDHHLGKYNGLGGKLEADEDVLGGMRREIHEEAGIACEAVSLRGTISWPGFGKGGEDWLGFVFLVERYRGTPFTHNPEGALEWVDLARLQDLPMWEGDRHFLPLVFDGDPRPFHGVMPYRDGRMQSWRYSR
jgi:8-oxo-dGTP diphosphatase